MSGRKAAECITIHDLEIGITSNSGLAVSVRQLNSDKWHWIPLSQVEDQDPDGGVMVMTKWIAQQKGLI